jgi:hypothetical protein
MYASTSAPTFFFERKTRDEGEKQKQEDSANFKYAKKNQGKTRCRAHFEKFRNVKHAKNGREALNGNVISKESIYPREEAKEE